MKRICLLTLLALGLTGFAAAANDTWVTPQPVKDYLYTTNPMATNEFFDLSTAYTENGGEIALDAAAQAYGVQKIMVLGKGLADGAALNNLFFGYGNGAWVTATRTGANSKTTAFPLQNLLENASCGFMEKSVTGLIVSAAGGVYLTDEAGENAEMTLPDPLADLKTQAVQYAARGFVAKYTADADGNYAKVLNSVPITKMADKPVCHIALCQDHMTGLKYILVQYNLLVNNHALVYQIKMGDDGRVEYRIGQQDKTTDTPDDDDYYTFRIDLKRNADALSFGGTASYVMSPVEADFQKTAWVCNTSQSLNKRRLSIYPKNGVITGVSSYTSIDATVVLSAKSQEVVGNATGLLVIASPQTSVSPKFENKAYQVGDYIENANDFRKAGYPVVYSGTPADLTDISFTAYSLTPNEKYYLYAFLCKQDGSDYQYSTDVFVSSDEALKTKPMDTPDDITAGEPEGDNIPLTFSASPFKLLVMKSTTAATNEPKGDLKAGDTYGEGTVVAVLDKNATTCNIPMTPGEMTYVQMYAMTDDEIPGYSSNFSLLPLYRQAKSLPLSYTFDIKDFIAEQPDNAMPILPPGLSTSTAFDGDRRLEAFAMDAPNHMEQGNKLLTSYLNDGAQWPNVIMPAFSGVMQIQASFNVQFYKWAMTGHSAASPVANDLVRIEYRVNGGAWQIVRQFTGDDMPEAVNGYYPLSASINCRPVDVVEIRYSYHSDPNTKHAIVSYEFIDASDCEMPTNLKVATEKMTDKAVTLTWRDNNNPAAGSYRVSYQKYVAPVVDEDGSPVAPDEPEDEEWETLTVNTTTAKLRNLENGSTYTVQVQAVCFSGESYPSSPVRVTAPAGLPYEESLTFADYNRHTQDYAVKPNVSVYKGEPGEGWETADYLQSIEETPDSWNARYSETGINMDDPDALAVSTAQDQAILVTPAIYIHPYVTPLPKTLTFRANTFNMDFENGVDLLDEDLRLYVLVSNSDAFSWHDTVASYDHNALKAETTSEEITDRGQDFSIDLEKFEGLVRIAFFFHNPNIVTESEDNLPMFLEILNISLNYDGEVPCFPVDDLHTANIGATEATLVWDGEGEEYGITYYPTNDKSQAKTVYQDATDTDLQTLKLENLKVTTNYTAEVVSYCTKGDRENGSIATSVKFRTLRELYAVAVDITPQEAGTVKGAGSYFEGFDVTLTATPNEGYKFVAWKDGETELSNEATYEFTMPGRNVAYTAVFTDLETYSVKVSVTPAQAGTVKGAGRHLEGEEVTLTATANDGYKFVAWMDGETELSKQTTYKFTMPSGNVAYTAIFEENTANEDMVRANFSVSTYNGQLIIRNLNGLIVKDVDIFGLTGNRINRFTPNSREDLTLPVNAGHTLVFVRLHTESGTAVYKVYVN